MNGIKKTITKKVIKILDNYSILIDYGYSEGAEKGDIVRIIEIGDEIYDCDETPLGTLDTIKETLEIVTTYEYFSICQKLSITNSLNPFILQNFNKTNKLPLKIKDDDLPKTNEHPNNHPKNNFIIVGDIAQIIKED